MTVPGRTYLAFHHNAKLFRLKTTIVSARPFAVIEEANRQLFKQASEEDHVVVTKETIFHPQGGGQPSDEGSMSSISPDASSSSEANASSSSSSSSPCFTVRAVRMDVVNDGQVLHLGSFGNPAAKEAFSQGATVEQAIDTEKRLLYSRLHTAGHVLGAAVRHLLEDKIEGFDELKASHFPESAGCEFQGAIENKWKPDIQEKINDYVKRAMPVEIDFWTEEDFRREGLERLVPDRRFLAPGETKFRVVKIVGAEVYPCGGTHVDTTDLCGETTVRKIATSKGTSRVSYNVSRD